MLVEFLLDPTTLAHQAASVIASSVIDPMSREEQSDLDAGRALHVGLVHGGVHRRKVRAVRLLTWSQRSAQARTFWIVRPSRGVVSSNTAFKNDGQECGVQHGTLKNTSSGVSGAHHVCVFVLARVASKKRVKQSPLCGSMTSSDLQPSLAAVCRSRPADFADPDCARLVWPSLGDTRTFAFPRRKLGRCLQNNFFRRDFSRRGGVTHTAFNGCPLRSCFGIADIGLSLHHPLLFSVKRSQQGHSVIFSWTRTGLPKNDGWRSEFSSPSGPSSADSETVSVASTRRS